MDVIERNALYNELHDVAEEIRAEKVKQGESSEPGKKP
jgi:hypothetical protein